MGKTRVQQETNVMKTGKGRIIVILKEWLNQKNNAM